MNPAAGMIILSTEVVVHVDKAVNKRWNAKFQEQTKSQCILDLGIWLHVEAEVGLICVHITF